MKTTNKTREEKVKEREFIFIVILTVTAILLVYFLTQSDYWTETRISLLVFASLVFSIPMLLVLVRILIQKFTK